VLTFAPVMRGRFRRTPALRRVTTRRDVPSNVVGLPRVPPGRPRRSQGRPEATTGTKARGAATSWTSATTTSSRRLTPTRGRGTTFWTLTSLVGLLCIVGMVMVLSASSVLSIGVFGSPWHYFERQAAWLAVGIVGFAVAALVPMDLWRRLSKLAMVVTIAMLVAVLVPGVGVSAGGASRWLGTSSLQIQPSELAKLSLILFAADVLDRRSASSDWKYRFAPVLIAAFVLVALIMKQPDMGTSMVLMFTVGVMMLAASMPARPLMGFGALTLVGGYVYARSASYRWQRMTAFLHPLSSASSTGYQSAQALFAMSHGHLLGDGIGSSLASYGWLPNAESDFIFAVLSEETGLVGGTFMAVLFLAFASVGVRVACRARSGYQALVAAGVTGWLVGQAVLNIGAVVGLLPVTGVPLPFVSFGGTSLVIALFGAGMLANISSTKS